MKELQKILKGFYNENKKLVITTIIVQIITSLLEYILVPLILSNAFNNIKQLPILKKDLIYLVAVWIIIKIMSIVNSYYTSIYEPSILNYITLILFTSILTKYENENTAINPAYFIENINIIKNNLHEISHILFSVLIPRTIVLICSSLYVFFINKNIGIIVFICICLQYIFMVKNIGVCTNKTLDMQTQKEHIFNYIDDIIRNINTVQTTPSAYDLEIQNLKGKNTDLQKKYTKTYSCINRTQYTGYSMSIILITITIYILYDKFKNKNIDSSQVTTLIFLIIGIFSNSTEIIYYVPETMFRYSILSVGEKWLKTLNVQKNITEHYNHRYYDNYDNSPLININNVSFKYKGSSYPIFINLNLHIYVNTITTIFGESGSGKSTLIKLLFRIENPDSGIILFERKNIQDIKLRELRNKICYINQNTSMLFENKNIYQNIIYGHDINDISIYNQLIFILEIFDIYNIFKKLDGDRKKFSFLQDYPKKIDLSTGQLKVIHLLRCEFNNLASLIILDEPTSSFDIKTRDNFITYLQYIISVRKKTIIIISHDIYFKQISDNVINL